jgi:hypothetical protein
MAYKSPLYLLDSLHLQPDELTPDGLVRLRKKLIAEFNLSAGVTITVGDKQYTKDEALKAIDRLKDSDHLSEHAIIFRDKALLGWLENPISEPFPAKSISEQRWSGRPTDFFYSVLAEALLKHCSWWLSKRKFGLLKEPLAVAFALPVALQDDLLTMIYEQLENVVATLEAAIEQPHHGHDHAAFSFIIYDDWPDFLNSLPSGTFWGVINDFCINAINYTVSIQHDQRQFAYEITHQLIRTNCDEGLKTTIQSNYVIYRTNYYKPSTAEASSPNYWRIGWVIIILLKLAYTCSSY